MNTTKIPVSDRRLNTSTQRGKAAELRAMAWLIEAGFEVFQPASDDSRVDLVYRRVNMNGKHGPWLSAQVKRVYDKNGFPTCNLVRSNGQRYQKDDVDFLFAVSETEMHAIPFAFVHQYSRLRLTEKWDLFVKRLR
jgi:hypothetical protein